MRVAAVETGLPILGPLAWATAASGILFTAQVPLREDGTFETGSMEAQARQTFENLRQTVEAAGGSLADVAQVVVYLTDVTESAAMSSVWEEFFPAGQPNRATIGGIALNVLDIRIEITAYAAIDRLRQSDPIPAQQKERDK